MGISSGQAAGMGGADKPAGARAENTFQNKIIKQYIIIVRYKPKPPDNDPFGDLNPATNLLKGVTDKVDSVVSAVEGAMDNIPGLEMFIKEKKKESSSQTDYQYDYSDWDKNFDRLKSNLQEMNPESKTGSPFEFNSLDADGRKKDAQKLCSQVKSDIASWSKYTVWLHFIGIGQGAHVVNECTDLLANDSQFRQEEKWCVKSIIFVGSALYKDRHVLNEAALRNEGTVSYFGSKLDLTQHAVDYFEPTDKLLQLIRDANKNTLSLAVGKVKLHVIRILALVLGGLTLGTGDTKDLDKPGLIKNEVIAAINEIVAILKKCITDVAAFIDPGKLPEFGKMLAGYGDIPGQCEKRLGNFFDHFGEQALNQVKHSNVSMGPKDLAGMLDCLCPLFDHVTASLSVFKYDAPASIGLAQQIIDSAGIKTVYAPSSHSIDTDLSEKDNYVRKNKDDKPVTAGRDLAFVYVSQTQTAIGKAAESSGAVTSLSDDKKVALAEAIYALVRPMMVSKEQVYTELLALKDKFIHFGDFTKDISANKLMSFPAAGLNKLGDISYPSGLQDSISNTDQQINRLKGYFNRDNYGLQEDSQYFIFNSHNLVTQKMPQAVLYCLDQATTYLDYQRAKGQDNEFPTTGTNKYNAATSKPKDNVLPAKPLPAQP